MSERSCEFSVLEVNAMSGLLGNALPGIFSFWKVDYGHERWNGEVVAERLRNNIPKAVKDGEAQSR